MIQKKILCLIGRLHSGGAERQLVGLAKFLHEREFRVKVVWYCPGDFYRKELEENNIQHEFIGRGNSIFSKLLSVSNEIDVYKPDIVIAYLNRPSVIACILRLFKRSKFKLIVSERAIRPLNIVDRIGFWLYRYADFIVPNSKSQFNFLTQNYPSLSHKINTITNFVETDFFVPNMKKQQSKTFLILGIGRVHPQKNILTLIDAIHLLVVQNMEIELVWYGSIDDLEYNQKCIDRIMELGLSEFVSLKPATTDVLSAYQNADLFCLPSFYEGYPNVICEAMSCGLPVVCSNICDNPDIVCDGVNGFLFEPNSPKNISEKIKSIMDLTTEQRLIMGRNNREFAIEQFSTKTFVSKYIDLI